MFTNKGDVNPSGLNEIKRPSHWSEEQKTIYIMWMILSLACQQSGYLDESDGPPAHCSTCKPGTVSQACLMALGAPIKRLLLPQTKSLTKCTAKY